MKKILILMMLLFASGTMMASETFLAECDDGLTFEFEILNSNSVKLINGQVGLYALGDEYTVPSYVTYDGTTYTITEIGKQAFLNTACKKLTIPGTIKKVGEQAFAVCWDIETVIFEFGVETIGDDVFSRTTSVSEVSFPLSLKEIGARAFAGCELTHLNMPTSVTKIGTRAFASNPLTELTVNAKTIGDEAFANCDQLTNLTIGSMVNTIGEGAFYKCESLGTVYIPKNVNTVGISAFAGCKNLSSVIIEDGVGSLGQKSFMDCSSLSSITIPGSVSHINKGAFIGCKNLSSVIIEDGVKSLGPESFKNCSSLSSITIPGSVTSLGQESFMYCSSLSSITIPGSVTLVGYSAFEGCNSLTSVVFEEGTQRVIGDDAFSECSSLVSVKILNSEKTKINKSAFYNCKALSELILEEGVDSIGVNAFYGCNNLFCLIIPNSVTTIGKGAFYKVFESISSDDSYKNRHFKVVQFGSGLQSRDREVFCYATKIGTLVDNSSVVNSSEMYHSVKTYKNATVSVEGDFVFVSDTLVAYIGNDSHVDIPNKTSKIGAYAFSGKSFTSISIPDDIPYIPEYSFMYCDRLKSVDIPCVVDANAFEKCSSLESVNISGYVGYRCFKDCSSLKSVNILNCHSDFRFIDGYAFQNCSSLTEVIIAEGFDYIGPGAFYNCESIASITIPTSMSEIVGVGDYYSDVDGNEFLDFAFEGCTALKTVINLSSLDIVTGSETHGKVAYYADTVITKSNNADNPGNTDNPETTVSEVENSSTILIVNGQILVNGEAPAFVVTVSGKKIANANLKAGVYFVVADGNSMSVVVR